jgi:hypothetical protein
MIMARKELADKIDEINKTYNEGWNAAIEAAAKELETYEYIEGAADRIRDLKK